MPWKVDQFCGIKYIYLIYFIIIIIIILLLLYDTV